MTSGNEHDRPDHGEWKMVPVDGSPKRLTSGAVHPPGEELVRGTVDLPVLTDRSLGPVMSVRQPFSAGGSGLVRPFFYRDVTDFHRHLQTDQWAAAIVDFGLFQDHSSRPDLSGPFWRLDVVDQLLRLKGIPDRPMLALIRDRFDLSAQAALAEAMTEAMADTPTFVGVVSSLDDIERAFAGLASDGSYWVGIPHRRIRAVRGFLDVMEDEGRTKTGYWMRHLLVAAAAGFLGPQMVAKLLNFRAQTVKSWSSRIDGELRKAFDLAPPGYPMSMIAATAQALQPWLWLWARRHRGHFEFGFLEQLRPDALGGDLPRAGVR